MPSLNLGCGKNKLANFVNIDVEKDCEPDIVCDFIHEPLPYEGNSIDNVVLFHTIEHIPKKFHRAIFQEIARVLIKGGDFTLSYPEFIEVAQRWIDNKQGKREWWEKTIFGRQLYPADYHVSAMDSAEVRMMLIESGFRDIIQVPESYPNEFNKITFCTKQADINSYESQVAANKVVFIK